MPTVMRSEALEPPLTRAPDCSCEIETGGVRLVILPPGDIDATMNLRRSAIAMNVGTVRQWIGINSDRKVERFLAPSTMVYWPKGTSFTLIATRDAPSCILEIDDGAMMSWFDDAEIADQPRQQFRIHKPDPFATALSRSAIAYLMRSSQKHSKVDNLTVEAYALGITSRMFARLTGQSNERSHNIQAWTKRGSNQRIGRAIELLESRLSDQNLCIADLAAAAGLSPCYFGAVFKSRLGVSPYLHILRRRAELARDLVKGTDMALAEIAFRTGFSSQAHMTTLIKRFYGTTPGRLRQ